jgi:hypothetical protein
MKTIATMFLMALSMSSFAEEPRYDFQNKNCVNSMFARVLTKVDGNTYEVIIQGTGIRDHAIFQFDSVEIKTTGTLTESIFLEYVKVIEVPLKNGFKKNIPFYKESKDCKKQYLSIISNPENVGYPLLTDQEFLETKRQVEEIQKYKANLKTKKEARYNAYATNLKKILGESGFESFQKEDCHYVDLLEKHELKSLDNSGELYYDPYLFRCRNCPGDEPFLLNPQTSSFKVNKWGGKKKRLRAINDKRGADYGYVDFLEDSKECEIVFNKYRKIKQNAPKNIILNKKKASLYE